MLADILQQEKKDDVVEVNESIDIPKCENLTNESNGQEEKVKNGNDSPTAEISPQTDKIVYPEPKIGKEIPLGAKVVKDTDVSKPVENKSDEVVNEPLKDTEEDENLMLKDTEEDENLIQVEKINTAKSDFDAILSFPPVDPVNNTGWTDVVSPEPMKTKKRICFSYRDIGHCKYGPKCKFSHNYPRKDCWRYETHGYCQYEKYCRYRHVADAIRDPWQGKQPSRYRPAPDRYVLPPRGPGGYEDPRTMPRGIPKRRLHETEKYCFQFSSEGWCRYGSGCRFRHIVKPAETSEFDLGGYDRERTNRYVGYSNASLGSSGGIQPYPTHHTFTSALGPIGYNTASPGLPVSNDSSHNISPSEYNYLTYEPSYYIYQ